MTKVLIVENFKKLIDQLTSDYMNANINNDTSSASALKFRISSLSKALAIIKKYDKPIVKGSDLAHITGVGKGTIDRIDEIINTGTLSELRHDADKKLDYINNLKTIINVGDKVAKDLVEKHGIKTVAQLKKAVEAKKIKVNREVMLGLKYHDIVKGDIPRSEITKVDHYLKRVVAKLDTKIILKICGSYRRGKATSGDIDVVIFHPKYRTIEHIKDSKRYKMQQLLVKLVDILTQKKFLLDNLTNKNYTSKYMGFCRYKNSPVRRIDITFSPYLSAPTALLHHTGPFELNEYMRQIAKNSSMLLNQYGLFKKKNNDMIMLKATSERDIFDYLDMDYLTPAERDGFSAGKLKKF